VAEIERDDQLVQLSSSPARHACHDERKRTLTGRDDWEPTSAEGVSGLLGVAIASWRCSLPKLEANGCHGENTKRTEKVNSGSVVPLVKRLMAIDALLAGDGLCVLPAAEQFGLADKPFADICTTSADWPAQRCARSTRRSACPSVCEGRQAVVRGQLEGEKAINQEGRS